MPVEPGRGGQGDEELAAAGIGTGIGHGQDTLAVMYQTRAEFIFDPVPRAAPAGAGGIAALDHEAVDDTVKDDSVIETFFRKFNKVFSGLGSLLLKHLRYKHAFVGL